ncbi:MAG: serine/threonine protein kinase [Gemmataceae bacterium]|nr:serine/threonine protein kinase [Gemmataceae bacterium]
MTDLVGKRLGEFEVVRVLGRGGMGVVYEAVQTSLRRRVALKVLGPGVGLTPRAVDRFRREAAAAAKLHHTNIVPVYATGEDGGLHFYAMELIDGPSLDRVILDLANRDREPRDPNIMAGGGRQDHGTDGTGRNACATGDLGGTGIPACAPDGSGGTGIPACAPDHLALTGPYVDPDTSPLPSAAASSGLSSGGAYFDAVARMAADVADALDHAHRHGVVHRDVKPSNLLLAPDGRLSVNDFGLARVLEEPGVTVTGEFVGTPAYTAPEQVAGGRVPVDHRADVYSLGATLYELLTLRRPFAALGGRDQLLAAVLQKDPVPPRRVNPRVPKDLETICLKCLEKDPDRRYRSAKDLADDLRRYVNRFAILARRPGVAARAGKWVRRNPAVAASLAAVLVLATAAAGAFAWQARVAEHERAEADRKREDEVRLERLQAAMDRALAETMAGRLGEAEAAVRDAERLGASTADLRRLKGQVALWRADFKTAVEELTVATELRPDGMAEWALLASAAFWAGDEARYIQIVGDRLDKTTPRSAEDFLYSGQAISINDPGRGLPLMERAVELRDGAIPRSVRGNARSFLGLLTEDPALVEKGSTDVRIARELLGDNNPVAVADSLRARMHSALVFEAVGQPAKAREAWEQARADVDLLTRVPDHPYAAYWRCEYLRVSGQDGAGAFRAAARFRTDIPLAALNASYAYARGSPDDIRAALLWLDDAEAVNPAADLVRTSRIFLLSALGDSERNRARAEYDRHVGKSDDPSYRMVAAEGLLLLGRAGEARAALEELRGKQFPSAYRKAYTALLDHSSGRPVTEAEVIEASSGHRFLRCETALFLGLRNLSGGDREAAKRHLRDGATRYRCPMSLATWWCMAFLARMEKDPAWPPWIPPAK